MYHLYNYCQRLKRIIPLKLSKKTFFCCILYCKAHKGYLTIEIINRDSIACFRRSDRGDSAKQRMWAEKKTTTSGRFPPSETQGQSVGHREKGGTKVFKYGQKSPWVPIDSHRTISKNSSRCWLLIGHKKCFVLLCQSGNSFSWVLFVSSYTTAIVSSLSGSCTREMHAARKLSVWCKISIWFQNIVCPKTKDAFPKMQAWAYNSYSHLHI